MPAIVQERACRRATTVRSILVKFPSSITGLEAKVARPSVGLIPRLAGSKRHCNARERAVGVWRVYRIWFLT